VSWTGDDRAAARPRQALRSLAVVVGMAVIWEAAKMLFALPSYQLPHLHEIALDFLREGAGGERWLWIMTQNAGYTALESLIGFTLGGVTGLVLAIGFAHSRWLERGLLPYVIASQTVPILAIAPMVVVWLGTSWFSKAVIAAYLTFFPVTVNMSQGLRAVDPDALALMRALAASSQQILFKLRFPAALPYLFTALRISATASVIGAIVGELPVGSRRHGRRDHQRRPILQLAPGQSMGRHSRVRGDRDPLLPCRGRRRAAGRELVAHRASDLDVDGLADHRARWCRQDVRESRWRH